jgi:hypothetical protein
MKMNFVLLVFAIPIKCDMDVRACILYVFATYVVVVLIFIVEYDFFY